MSNMKSKEGYLVEVCRSDGSFLRSSFRAKIVACDADYYRVECDNLLNDHGKLCVEDVKADAIRPEPPRMAGTRTFASGHMIEVYDNHSWKVGRVLKALPGRLFVVKLMESLGQRTFHQSVIRPQLLWENEAWLHNVEGGGDHLLETEVGVQNKLHFGNQFVEQNVEANFGCNENEQFEVEDTSNKLLVKNLKRKTDSKAQLSHRGDVLKTKAVCHKRSAIKKSRHQDVLAESALHMLEKVDPFSSQRILVSEECECISPKKVGINHLAEEAESIQCSVASNSSSNELNNVVHSDNKNIKYRLNESHFDDAQSSCECPNGRHYESFSENEEESKLHQLEFHAYRSTMRAFYASRYLTWGRETLLTNLRLELHISDDEHLSELTSLCYTKVQKSKVHAYYSTMRAFHASGNLSWEREALLTNLRLELHISDDEHLSELTRLCSAKVL